MFDVWVVDNVIEHNWFEFLNIYIIHPTVGAVDTWIPILYKLDEVPI